MAEKKSGLDKINEAAVRLIGLRGFAEATTQGIAKAAKVSEGLIYRYYETKPMLGQGLFHRHYQEVLAMLTAAKAKHEDPVDGLREATMAFFRWFDENPDVARFVLRTHSEFLDKEDNGEALMDLVGEGVRGVLGEELFSLFPNDLLSAMVLGAMLQVAVECMHGQIEGPLAPRMEPVVDAMAAYIQAVRSGASTGGAGDAAEGGKAPDA